VAAASRPQVGQDAYVWLSVACLFLPERGQSKEDGGEHQEDHDLCLSRHG